MQFAYAPIFYLAVLFSTPQEGKWDFRAARVAGWDVVLGKVLAITKTSITVVVIDKFNNKRINEVLTYPFHKRLAAGSYNLLASDSNSYTRDDLEVGDKIRLRYLMIDKTEYCISFCIFERPGGKIPPTRRYRLGDWHPYHEYYAASRALDRDGTPLPRHLGGGGEKYEYPAFDPDIPRRDRIKPWPVEAPFTYMEYLIFMR